MGESLDVEFKMYRLFQNTFTMHPGRLGVRSLLDTFRIQGPEDQHQCLVHVPLFESVWTFLHRNPIGRLPSIVLAGILQRLFLALDYLHTKCHVIHTGKFF